MVLKRSSGPKIRSRMLSRRVGSLTCWLTNKESISEMRETAVRQLNLKPIPNPTIGIPK